MGCDIHSIAEIRDPETGQWKKIGNIFPYGYSSVRRKATDELLDQIPENLRDGILLDLVDFYIHGRDVEKKDYYTGDLPEIETGSDLAAKVIAFQKEMTTLVEAARENRKDGPEQKFAREGVHHDPDAWPKWRHAEMERLGKEANLTDDERTTLRTAILNHGKGKYTTDEEAQEDGYGSVEEANDEAGISINFHRFHGDGWFSKYRSDSEQKFDKDAPEYLNDGLPFWREDLGWHDEPFDSRNYSLFAVLADVRNGSGFAGVDTGDRVTPISEPRGIPEDASPEYTKLAERWGVDGHSHTYHTLKQMRDYPWDEAITYRGIVSAVEYERMKLRGYDPTTEEGRRVRPEGGVSGWISGAGIVVFTIDGYEQWKDKEFPFLRQPETSLFMPDIPVSADLVPDINPAASALAAAPAFQKPGDTAAQEVWENAPAEDAQQKDIIELLTADKPNVFGDRQKNINGVSPFVKIEWVETIKPNMGTEFWNALDVLAEYAADQGVTDEDVRVVMHFDN